MSDDIYNDEGSYSYSTFLWEKRLLEKTIWPKFLKGKKIIQYEDDDKFVLKLSPEFKIYLTLYEDDGNLYLEIDELESEF